MSTPILIAVQKLYFTLEESVQFAKALRVELDRRFLSFELILCPSLVNLAHVSRALRDSRVSVAAQNFHQSQRGAFTGQVSLSELLELGIHSVMIGHSELRRYQGETDHQVRSKIEHCRAHKVRPIVCIGESAPDHEEGRSQSILDSQIHDLLGGLEDLRGIVIAYEPGWTSKVDPASLPGAQLIKDAELNIRHAISKHCKVEQFQNLPVLFGGGVSLQAIAKIMAIPGLSGLVLSRSAVCSASFFEALDLFESLVSSRSAKSVSSLVLTRVKRN